MKRLLTVLFALLMVVSCFALAACGGANTGSDATETGASSDKNEFSVSWKNWNGDFIKYDPAVAKGTVPAFGQADPTRPDDDENSYTFAGWDPAPAPIDRDMIYTATYTSVPLPQHEVTAEEFLEAFNFAGKNYTMSSGVVDCFQLEDGTGLFHFKEDASWYGYYPNPDGTWTLVSADDDDKTEEGQLIWYLEDSLSDGMKEEGQNPLAFFKMVLEQAPYSDYTYRQDSETYEANVVGAYIQLKFDHKNLIRCSVSSDGATFLYEIGNYGTTVIDELESIHHPIVYLKAKKGNQFDVSENLYLGNKKDDSVEYRVELRFDEPEGTVDYNQSRFLFSLVCIGVPEGKALLDGTVYIKGEDYSVEITMNGNPVTIEYEPMFKTSYFYLFSEGTKPDYSKSYYLDVKVTTLKDLSVSEGLNYISINSSITNVN